MKEIRVKKKKKKKGGGGGGEGGVLEGGCYCSSGRSTNHCVRSGSMQIPETAVPCDLRLRVSHLHKTRK